MNSTIRFSTVGILGLVVGWFVGFPGVNHIQQAALETDGLVSRIQRLENSPLPPVGSIIAFVGDWNHEMEDTLGYALCDGREISESDTKFAALRHLLKPDADNLFKLPKLDDGRFLEGGDPGEYLDQNLPAHRHKWATTYEGSENLNHAPYYRGLKSWSTEGEKIDFLKHHADQEQCLPLNGNTRGRSNDDMKQISHKGDLYTENKVDLLSVDDGDRLRPRSFAVNWIIRYR